MIKTSGRIERIFNSTGNFLLARFYFILSLLFNKLIIKIKNKKPKDRDH